MGVKRYQKRVALLMVCSYMCQFLLGLIQPSFLTLAQSNSSQSNLTVQLTVNGQLVNTEELVELKPGDVFEFSVSYKDLATLMEPGSQLVIGLPISFGQLVLSEDKISQHFSQILIEDNQIILTTKDDLETAGGGHFTISGVINQVETEVIEKVVIDVSGTKVEFDTIIKPEGATDCLVTKTINGTDEYKIPHDESGSIIGQRIPYTIVINEQYTKLENAMFKDMIPAGMEIDLTTLKVEKMRDGNLVPADEYTILTTNPLEIDLGTINQKYVITYDLIITEDHIDYINEVFISSSNKDTVTDTATAIPDKNVPSGESMLNKWITSGNSWIKPNEDGTVVGQVVSYEVSINDLKEMIYHATFTDIIPDGMSLIWDSIEIIKEERGKYVDITDEMIDKISQDGQSLIIDFGDIHTKYIIKYQTVITEDKNVYTNQAHLDWDDGSADKSVDVNVDRPKPGNGNINKWTENGNLTVDENNSLVGQQPNFSIIVNNELTEKVDLKLTDTMPDGMKLNVDSIKIYKEIANGEFIEVTGQFNGKMIVTEDGFEIDFGTTDQRYKVEYSTTIVEDKEAYTNQANINFGGHQSEDSSATVKPQEPAIKPGEGEDLIKKIDRYGEHDFIEIGPNWQGVYTGETVTYKITVNENYEAKKNVTLTDYLPQGMEFVKDSIQVTKVDRNYQWSNVTAQFKDKISFETISDQETMTIDFSNISDKYFVTYTVKITEYQADGWINNAKLVFENGEAEDSTIVKPTTDEVKVPIVNKKVNGKDEETIYLNHWYWYEIVVNEQETSKKDVVLIDTLPDGMKLDVNSIVIRDKYWNDVTSQFAIEKDEKFIKIDFKDINQKYTVGYSAIIFDSKEDLKESYVNVADLTWKGGSDSDFATIVESQPTVGEHEKLYKMVEGKPEITIEADASFIGRELNYKIIVNDLLQEKKKVVVTDTLPEGLELVSYSLAIYKVTGYGSEAVTAELRSNGKITETSSGFEIDFGDISTRYIIEYKARVKELKESYINLAVETSDTGMDESFATVIVDLDGVTPDEEKVINKTSTPGKVTAVGDVISYQIVVNNEYKRLINATLKDAIPDGMKLLTETVKVIEHPNQYWSQDITWQLKQNNQLIMDESYLEIQFGDSYSQYVIEYQCEVTELKMSYHNVASLEIDNLNSTPTEDVEVVFDTDAAVFNRRKTADRMVIDELDENQEVVYTISVWNETSELPSGYFTISDPIDERLVVLDVWTSSPHFEVIYDEETHTVKSSNIDLLEKVSETNAWKIFIRVSFEHVKAGETVKNIAIVNDSTPSVEVKKGYAFEAIKIDAITNQPLQGAVFELYKVEQQLVFNFIRTKDETLTFIKNVMSDEVGRIYGSVSEPGQYVLKEIKAPSGYQILQKEIRFEITESDLGKTIHLGTIENIPQSEISLGTLKITKTNLSGKELLDGAIFEIRNQLGEVVASGSTQNGVVEFSELPMGDYTYQEIKAPDGYQLDSTVYSFSITEDEKVVEVTVTNCKNRIFENLPATGGHGESLYTIGGSLLMISTIAFLYMKEKNKQLY